MSAIQTLILRPQYTKQLEAWRDKSDVIKVITGIRRCGKSTLFQLFQTDLFLDHGVSDAQVQQINFEDANFFRLIRLEKTA